MAPLSGVGFAKRRDARGSGLGQGGSLLGPLLLRVAGPSFGRFQRMLSLLDALYHGTPIPLAADLPTGGCSFQT